MGNHLRISLLSIYVCAAIDTLGFIIRGWGVRLVGMRGLYQKYILPQGTTIVLSARLPIIDEPFRTWPSTMSRSMFTLILPAKATMNKQEVSMAQSARE
jgi:hypothetical protein